MTGADDFVCTIDDVLTIGGSDVVIFGVVESGECRDGDWIDVWDGAQVVMTVVARLELYGRRPVVPGQISLGLGQVDPSRLRAGQVVRIRPEGAP
ncbi:hypothetical protein [Aeromicrobium choanae]|uniref:hypothetical protein n=1 Tax=Aeromicrobium choanae TaxID=1736691 RepID=UPI0009992ECE|nr:hypothetical protein [Aeromicrobium choanae]